MIFKRFLIFTILCLITASKVQGKLLKDEVLQTSAKLNNQLSATAVSEVKLNAKDNTEHAANQSDADITRETQGKLKADASQQEKKVNEENNNSEVFTAMQMHLNEQDKLMLQNLNRIIEKVPGEKETDEDTAINRERKSFRDEHWKRAAEALTDDEIAEIIKSISHPTHSDDITEDIEAFQATNEMEIEPRILLQDERRVKLLKSNQGYYVVVFTPLVGDTPHDRLAYSRLQILPAARSTDANSARFISNKAWNKYIRRLMHQIRKGTRLVQRKTKFRSLQEEEPALNEINQQEQQLKRKFSWFN